MSRPPRLSGFDYVGRHRYAVTTCTFDRHPAFREPPTATSVIPLFLSTARECGFITLAYCAMPDHLHLLAEGTTAACDLRRFMKRAKQRTGQLHRHRTGTRLWQEGYFDRVLRAEDDVKAHARYIIWNPVRAGLVQTPLEYPYLGSDVWSVRELVESIA